MSDASGSFRDSGVTTLSDTARIEHRAAFDFVRYANCWEDADILIEALQPATGSRVLSIASAGDNALALLAEGAEVVAVDLNLAQLACLELRCAAFRELDYEQVLAFLGVRDSGRRRQTYDSLAAHLSPAARQFWDDHPAEVARGIIHAGRFERFFRTFRTRVLPLIHSQTTIAHLLLPRGPDERHEFWTQRWNNRRWRWLFRLFFSRFLLGRLGRDPEFFRYVEGSVSERIMQRAQYGLTELPTHDNPFLSYIATGNFQDALPRYLREEHFDSIRAGLDRLTLVHGPIEQAAGEFAGQGFDAFNLSDIFEYVDEQTATRLYRELLSVVRPAARFAYWNTLVPRSLPHELADRVQPLDQLSSQLFRRDKAFFYCHFQVDEVTQEPPSSLEE